MGARFGGNDRDQSEEETLYPHVQDCNKQYWSRRK